MDPLATRARSRRARLLVGRAGRPTPRVLPRGAQLYASHATREVERAHALTRGLRGGRHVDEHGNLGGPFHRVLQHLRRHTRTDRHMKGVLGVSITVLAKAWDERSAAMESPQVPVSSLSSRKLNVGLETRL